MAHRKPLQAYPEKELHSYFHSLIRMLGRVGTNTINAVSV
jgi:hypothetical protein